MIYGIDLGTTNTIIGYGDKLYTDLVKSSVNMKTNKQCDDISNGDVLFGYKIHMTIQDSEWGKKSRKASSIVLKKVVDIANKCTGTNTKDLVISVPAAFTQLQRKGTIEAANMNGYNVVKIIDEPTAACIAAGAIEKECYLVIDIGGGTSDISIVDNTTGKYVVKATYGKFVGGDDLDNYIIDNYFVPNICGVINAQDLDNRAKLKNLAIKFKTEITKNGSMLFSGEEFDSEYDVELDYSDLEAAISEVFSSVVPCIKSTLADSRVTKVKALFVGGSCRNECLCDFVKSHLNVEYTELAIDKYLAVAKGVALYAKMIDEGVAADFVQPITKRIMARQHGDDDSNTDESVVIKPNLPIPRTEGFTFNLIRKTDKVTFDIYTGTGKTYDDCTYDGTVSFDAKNIKEGTPLYIEFTIDANNIFTVTCEDLDTGNQYKGELKFM